jgi:TolB-like protein/tetratricopeptide (TPR) repeat protein
MLCAFEEFVLDTDRRELRRDGLLVAVEPQVFDLIAFLVVNRHRVVSRDDVLEAVWHGRIVSESTLTTRINAARRALGDSGHAQRLIRTIHSRGFRFVGNLIADPMNRESRRPPGTSTIAVLPFDNVSDDPELDSLAAGITEDLTDALSKVPALSVFASNFAAEFRGSRPEARQVAGALRVRYLLAGSMQGSGQRLRVIARLIDGADGRCVWSDRYDHRVEDIFAQQDDITRKVLIEVCAKLTSGDHAHVVGRGTPNLNAWLLYEQAFEHWHRYDRVANFLARELFQRAHKADPRWSSPLAGLSSTYREAAIRGWGGSLEGNLEAATELAEKAVALGPDDATAYVHLANARIEMGRIEEGIRIFEKAVELAPGDYFPLSAFAHMLPRVGEEMRALSLFARSREARPVPSGACLANEAFVLHSIGNREQAIEALHESVDRCDIADAHVRLAAAYFEGDRPEEARAEIAHVLAREPDATIGEYTRNLPFRSRQELDQYQDLLRGARLPDQF